MVIFGKVKSQKDKIVNRICLLQMLKEQKHGKEGEIYSEVLKFVFSERESFFSLEIHAIRPSAVFGIRRRAALREEDFAWVPDLGSFLKLREVGVSPYLGFIPSLSTLRMFELNEAVRGRLIGPKTWDRIDGNFFEIFTVRDCRGCYGVLNS